jgi:hypothetical protein
VIDRDAVRELTHARKEATAHVGRPRDDRHRDLRRLALERLRQALLGPLAERLGAAQHDQRPRPEQRRRLDRVRHGVDVAIGRVVAELCHRPAARQPALDVRERPVGEQGVEFAPSLLGEEIHPRGRAALGAQNSSMIWS